MPGFGADPSATLHASLDGIHIT